MIEESIDFLFHSFLAPKYLVKLGLVQEIIGIKYRKKRQKDLWLEHQEKSKQEIIKTISKLTNKRKALIIGAGLLLDVPLKEFSDQFKEVILVDIFFLQESINEIKQYDNCRFEQVDISSTLKEAYYLWQNHGKNKELFDQKLKNLIYKKPIHFLLEEELDYVLSCNLLSQLSLAFEYFSKKKKMLETTTLKAFLESFETNHIEYLKAFPEETTVHLLTDTERIVVNKEGKELESNPTIDHTLLKDFREQDSWLWDLAYYGEIEKNSALKLKVQSSLLHPKLSHT
jgi:hypothetical protein